MGVKTHLAATLLAVSFCTSAQAQAVGTGPQLESQLHQLIEAYGKHYASIFDGRAQMLEGRGKFVNAIGDYHLTMAKARLTYAKARYIDAETLRKLEEVRFWRAMISRFELEMKNVRKQEYKFRKRADTLDKYLRSARTLQVFGRVNARNLRAYELTLIAIDPTVGNQVMFEEINEGKELGPENFTSAKKDDEIEAFAGGNLIELLDFLKDHNYSLKRGKDAHKAVAMSFESLVTSAEDVIRSIQNDLQAIRDSTLDFWDDIARQVGTITPGSIASLN